MHQPVSGNPSVRRWVAPLGATLVLALSATSSHGAPLLGQSTVPVRAAIERDLAGIAQSVSGVVGVAAWRLDGRGPRVLFNADQRYPLASTYKVAIAGAILAGVDAGRFRLDQWVPVEPRHRVPSEVIAERFAHPGVMLSLHNLLEVMLTESDNTATDLLMELAGGPAAVTAWVRQQGVVDLRVDRDTDQLIREFLGLPTATGGDSLAEAIDADTKKRLIAITAPGAGEPRLTFTLPVLEQAGRLALHIEGAEKKQVLKQALADGPEEDMPVRAVLRSAAPVTLYWCP